LKVIYIQETKETCDIVKRLLLKIMKILNIIKKGVVNNKIIYYLPIFKDHKITKYKLKKFSNKISKMLEKDESNIIALSEYLSDNKLLKSYLFAKNINILDGRYLFKNLSERILEYIFKIKGKELELRRSFYFN